MIAIGVIGTSWWADTIFLSTLQNHPHGRITAICGRNRQRAQEAADKWNIPHVYTDYNELIDSGQIQAVVIVTPNNNHFPITMKALEAGLHVICEKPLGMTYREAQQMADLAAQKGVKHLVPFTWRFMPTARYTKELIDGGYIGKPYHLNLRWYTQFGRGDTYQWRYDKRVAGSGVIGDLGSHFIDLATWYFGKITAVSCQLSYLGQRPPLDPDGNPYDPTDDTAVLLLRFANGASGSIHLSIMADEPLNPQEMEFHGAAGTLRSTLDFGTTQKVSGKKTGEESISDLPIPDHIWQGVSRENMFSTLADVFGKHDWMARAFITAIAEDKPLEPNFHDGAYAQRVIDAAIKSHHENRWIEIESIS
jgi:predicted dehydrogenase